MSTGAERNNRRGAKEKRMMDGAEDGQKGNGTMGRTSPAGQREKERRGVPETKVLREVM